MNHDVSLLWFLTSLPPARKIHNLFKKQILCIKVSSLRNLA